MAISGSGASTRSAVVLSKSLKLKIYDDEQGLGENLLIRPTQSTWDTPVLHVAPWVVIRCITMKQFPEVPENQKCKNKEVLNSVSRRRRKN